MKLGYSALLVQLTDHLPRLCRSLFQGLRSTMPCVCAIEYCSEADTRIGLVPDVWRHGPWNPLSNFLLEGLRSGPPLGDCDWKPSQPSL